MTQSNRRFRTLMFASLYVVQGVGLAYFRNFQKPYLNDLGVNPDVIGLLTLILQVPFVLKIFIGMVSDRVNLFGMGHRKPYICWACCWRRWPSARQPWLRPTSTCWPSACW